MFAVTECRVAIHCLGDKFLVFRVQVAEVGKLPITTVMFHGLLLVGVS
jgi:hypothetical protein